MEGWHRGEGKREKSRVRYKKKGKERKADRESTLWPWSCALALRPSSNHHQPPPATFTSDSSCSLTALFLLSLLLLLHAPRHPQANSPPFPALAPSWDDVSPLLRRSILLSLRARHGSSERQPSAIILSREEHFGCERRPLAPTNRLTDRPTVARTNEIFARWKPRRNSR